MNVLEVPQRLEALTSEASDNLAWLHDLPFRIMQAYEGSPNEIKKLRDRHPLGMTPMPVTWPGKLLYQAADASQSHNVALMLADSVAKAKGKSKPSMVMSSDGNELVVLDLTRGHSFPGDKLSDLAEHFDFLLPLFGRQRYTPPEDQAADLSAAIKMRALHDALLSVKGNEAWRADNGGVTPEYAHDMNLFMTRTLFCLFANRAGIFKDHLFDEIVQQTTAQRDGSDTHEILNDVFQTLNTAGPRPLTDLAPSRHRVARLPYVNGGLFRDEARIPRFSAQARRLLVEATRLDWSGINADIFGSMMQAVAQVEERSDFGMHYTSPANIRKVIDPLFMDSLREQLEAANGDVARLEALHDRLSSIRVMDPACGSGNFLIIAYRDLRSVEAEVIRRLRVMRRSAPAASRVCLSSFHGIDPVDFACETTRLSLWISKYQMDRALAEDGIVPPPSFPIADSGRIVVGNALRVDWREVFPAQDGAELYIIGNPPYLGRARQDAEQKADIASTFAPHTRSYKKMDYVSCWFQKAAEHIRAANSAGAAFVATNSICQGEHVAMLWPTVLGDDIEISYAWRSFPWRNSAKRNAGVTCAIVGIRRRGNGPKVLFDGDLRISASHINPYLADAPDVIVEAVPNKRTAYPLMRFGNMPADGGNLILTEAEADELIDIHPEANRIIRTLYGSEEFIDNTPRRALWIMNNDLELAMSVPSVTARIEATKAVRLKSLADYEAKHPGKTDKGLQSLAARAHQFREMHGAHEQILVVPSVSSERRTYLPVGFLPAQAVISNLAMAIYDPPAWVFSVIASRLHLVWAKAVGGQLETRLRYSNTLVYNTFPMPTLSHEDQLNLADRARDVLRARAPFEAEGCTIGWMYNPETMPASLLAAHRALDDAFESIYIGRPFQDDSERLTHLFKLYAKMTARKGKAA